MNHYNNLLFSILKLKSKILCLMPRRIVLIKGKLIGLLLYYFLPLRKKVASTNLKIAFPDKTLYKRKKILKKCYIHFGMLITEFLRLPYLNKLNINKTIKIDSHTKQLLKKNKPAIIMTGHFGNWELFLPMFGYNNYNISGVAQIQKNKAGEKFFNWLRNCDNSNVITKKKAIVAINEALKNEDYILLASDQNAGSKGTKNRFFNGITSTPKGAAILNIKNNVPIIIIFILMNKDYSYTVQSRKLDILTKNKTNEEIVSEINQKYNRELEKIIIKHPEQYFWFHKRMEKKYYQ